MVGSRRKECGYSKHKPYLSDMDFQKNKVYMAEQEENILETTQRREAIVRKKTRQRG